MSRKCTSGALLVAVAASVAGVCGCTAYSSINSASLDCTAHDSYVYDFVDPMNMSTAFSYGDTTTGATNSAAMAMVPADAPPCFDPPAVHIQMHHNNDWGSAAGFYGFAPMDQAMNKLPRKESAYEGLAFWARAPGNTGKSFMVVLDDYNTYDPTPLPAGEADAAADPNPNDSNCVSYTMREGGVSVTIIDPATGAVLSSTSTTVTASNACGNDYMAVVTATTDWRFYTIPLDRFHQTAMPNRVPNSTLPGTGLLTDELSNLLLRFPKESEVDLWIDNLGFYKKKVDGGP